LLPAPYGSVKQPRTRVKACERLLEPGTPVRARRVRSPDSGRRTTPAVCGRVWQPHGEARSAFSRRLRADAAAHHLGQLAGDGEAETRSRRLAALLAATVEALEHVRQLAAGDAWAVVGDDHDGLPALGVRGQPHRAAL